ncbi:MAG: hypothetical protein MJ252_28865, partial [archaeon]|nr:hypothetical protein [archaeon]
MEKYPQYPQQYPEYPDLEEINQNLNNNINQENNSGNEYDEIVRLQEKLEEIWKSKKEHDDEMKKKTEMFKNLTEEAKDFIRKGDREGAKQSVAKRKKLELEIKDLKLAMEDEIS